MKQKATCIPKIQVSFNPKGNIQSRKYVKCSREVYDTIMTLWNQETIMLYEEFAVFFLDRKNGIIGWRTIGQGSCSGVVVNLSLIFSIAVQCNCSSLIVVHNHPSGKTNPSENDKNITNKIRDGCKLFDLKLLDHLIICSDTYFSFTDEGLL